MYSLLCAFFAVVVFSIRLIYEIPTTDLYSFIFTSDSPTLFLMSLIWLCCEWKIYRFKTGHRDEC